MEKRSVGVVLACILVLFSTSAAISHCEIPCGIYDDETRVKMLQEHITTIEKAMAQIVQIQKENPVNNNQLVRWITNKEKHADALQSIVSQYFMTQRIKTDTTAYAEKLTLLHQMLIYAMKCKQTTDLSHIKTLKTLVKKFSALYFDHGHK